MTVKLDFYEVDQKTGIKRPIDGAYSFGNIFKGNQKKACFTIFNSGDTPAITPIVSVKEYPSEDNKYKEAADWKRISFMESSNYGFKLDLPDIQPNSWLQGKDTYAEDFNNYPVVAGTPLDSTWMTWQNVSTTWEVYNGWLQHNVDTMNGKVCWTQLPKSRDFIYSMKVTVRDGTFGGLLVRHSGDYDTGYIILVQGMYEHLNGVNSNEGIIQIYKGKYSDGIKSWTHLYNSPSVGIRGTHDFFKVRLKGNKIDIWYKNDDEVPPITYIDEDSTYNTPSQPVILCSAGSGSVLSYFDDIYMEVMNNNGVIWVQDTVDNETPVFGSQYSYLDIEYGGVE